MLVVVCRQKNMSNFLDYTPLLINGIELFTAIIITYIIIAKKWYNFREIGFLTFIWFTFFCDAFGSFYSYVLEISDNYFILNFYTIISIPFLLYWYRNYVRNKLLRTAILSFITIFLLLGLYNLLFFESKSQYLSILFLCGALFLIISIMFYYIEQLFSDQKFSFKNNLVFWISVGQIIFYLGMIPMISLNKYIMPFLKSNPLSFYIILLTLNVILYSSYIIGFLWHQKK